MNSQPDTSDEWLNRILSIAVPYMNEAWYKYPDDQEHMIKGFQNTQGYKEAKQAITAHINQAVLQAKLDELENNRSMMTNIGMVSPIEFAKYLRDRIATLTKQLEQEQPK